MTTRRRRSAERVTLSDVARSAGCSLMSASRALSQPDLVSDALRERVEQAVKALGYVPHPAARSLASSRSNLVAVIIPSLSNAVFVDTVEAIQRVLMPAGYEMMIGVSHYRPEEDERLLRAYLELREDETERFIDAYRRLGPVPFKAALYPETADA